ncbi:response regulator [Paenibacillus rigui]|uniref:Two-component system response regulator n=1 Tax=Paenibacillus rigui TaxID=554312 RepID=A0A229UZ34_9BACL|nr:response regulator [Paenibacillus rigui]OXM88395.1 two-component system response regulator [Paenibacillus rigui]
MAKIMIVDDAAFMRSMLRTILEDAGHTIVCEATNGLEAIDKYAAYRPDLVTMDITMPEMEGIDAVKHIRAIDAAAKIIMCSAMGQKMLIIEAIRAGALDFVVKPFQPERVHEAVNHVLEF